jgi:tetratricopeptide (TPR) repeat protein
VIGQTLGHYRIVAKIGAGGMGEVYRAHDEQLDRDVALKVLPTGTLADDAARKQFRREALALAKLNHPNIETVFEFSTQDGVDFLAMELIAGSPLSEKLKEGPLPEKEVVRLGAQFAEGLAAAHEQGVVHRDLKPGNLMITPDGRLKILDFGLAKLLHPESGTDATQSIATDPSAIAGTLPYMSPEQLRGLPVDARSDVYAAGAVLYEMATGRRPFPQSQGAELIGAILHQAPTRPNSANPRITPGLENAILKALDKEPTRRYQTARELQAVVESLSAGFTPAARPKRPAWPLAVLGATALAIVLAVGLVFGLNLGGVRDRLLGRNAPGAASRAPTASSPIRARRSVAVLGFKNLSGRPDEAWLSTALAEMITTELATGEQLRTVPEENVARMKKDLGLSEADSYAKDTLGRIRRNIGCDYVVLGTYLDLGKEAGGQLRLDLRLQDAGAGETLAAVSDAGTETGLFDLVSHAGSDLREKLGVGAISSTDAIAVRASSPSNPEATRLYAEGLLRLRLFDNLDARDLLEKAISADPNFALAHSALASAWRGLGYDAKSRDEAKRAFDLSANLSREDRLWIEGRYREATKEWDQAVSIYQKLFEFSPDNIEYGICLASAQFSAGMAKNAFTTVEALRRLPPPAGDDLRIDLTEAQAAEALSDYKRAAELNARAAEKASAQGARLLLASARLAQGWALASLGKPKEALAAFDEAKQIYADTTDRRGVARALLNTGTVLRNEGDLPGAKRSYEAALPIFRVLGDTLNTAHALNDLAQVLTGPENAAEAKRLMEESLAISRGNGDKHAVGVTLGNLGQLAYSVGDLAGAKKMRGQAIAIDREIGDRNAEAISTGALADILWSEGDLAGAKKMYERILAVFRSTGNKNFTVISLQHVGDVLVAQGALSEARKKYEEGLALSNEAGAKNEVTRCAVGLAEISIEEGNASQAEAPLRAAIDQFQKEGDTEAEATAQANLAEALLAGNRPADAQKAAQRAQELAPSAESTVVLAARISAALGEPAEAIRSLEAILNSPKHQDVGDLLEARLAIGEIEMKSGKTAAGRARLAVLEKVAGAKGFNLIARKAAAAAKE